MSNIILISVISLVILINKMTPILIKDVDWCASPYCKFSMNHTICKWGVLCPPDQTCESNLAFNKPMKDYVMHLHNKIRNKIALGEDSNVPENVHKAADMNVLQWHIHLEYVARCHSRQCHFIKDECRAVPDFSTVGQNIYKHGLASTRPDDIDVKKLIQDGIESWYNEFKETTEEEYRKYSMSESKNGYFAQMVWATTSHIGCGLSQTKDYENLEVFLVCNYGHAGNIDAKPIYEVGPPCSKCPEGKECNSKYTGLCGNIEEYAYKCPCEEEHGPIEDTATT